MNENLYNTCICIFMEDLCDPIKVWEMKSMTKTALWSAFKFKLYVCIICIHNRYIIYGYMIKIIYILYGQYAHKFTH